MGNPVLDQLNENISTYLTINREWDKLKKAVIEKRVEDAQYSMDILSEIVKKETEGF